MSKISPTILVLALIGCGEPDAQSETEQAFLKIQQGLELKALGEPCPTPGIYSDTSSLLIDGDIVRDWWNTPIEIAVGGQVGKDRISIVYLSGGEDKQVGEGKDYTMKSTLSCEDAETFKLSHHKNGERNTVDSD